MKEKCEICGKEFVNPIGLSVHLTKEHTDIISKKEYYDKFLKKETEGECYFCGNEAIFKSITNGYHKICNSKNCLGKTRATGTYEFLMYKYGLSKNDAIKLMNSRAEERGEKIKDGLNLSFEKNKNFFKEKSRQCTEFWLKKGCTLEDAKIEVKNSFDDIHTKTWKKRRENPELYQNVNTTQLGYWLSKGFSNEESLKKIAVRQKTFTLENCIIKYGEIDGLSIWNNRQINWSEKMKKTMLTRNYRKDFSKPEIELIKEIIKRFNFNIDEHYSGLNEQYFIYNNITKTFFTYDFVLKNYKKVIEFNGDYWHCNPKIYKEDFFNKNKQMFAKEIWKRDEEKIENIQQRGFETLIIWEYDYKNNKEEIIQRCIDFINK
jgi:hypothetical protein